MPKQEPPQRPLNGWGPIPYDAIFSAEEFTRLTKGVIPRSMDDKWLISYEDPHLFFYRSWTGKPVFRLMLTAREDGGATISEACFSKDFAPDWLNGPEYQVRLLGFLVSNLLLGQATPFPLPPGIPA